MLTDPLPAITLLHGVGMKLMAASDAGALADAYRRNRAYLAPQYLKIAGQWQDHVLFQRILQGPL